MHLDGVHCINLLVFNYFLAILAETVLMISCNNK